MLIIQYLVKTVKNNPWKLDQKAERFEIIFLFLKIFQQFIIPM